jgi:hypothetical protein
MRLFNIHGKLVSQRVSDNIIDWDGKSRSKIQFKVKQFFRPYWLSHIVYEEFPVYGTRLKVDFLNATIRLAIEVDGAQHNSFSKFFHQNRINYLHSLNRDCNKSDWLEKNGFKLINIVEEDIKSLSPEYLKDKFDVDI